MKEGYGIENTARGVIFDDIGYMALLKVTKENYYKLPGGKIEPNETKEQAFIREGREETGCEIKVLSFLGKIEQDFCARKVHQVSFIFIGEVVGEKKALDLTADEIARGFELIWVLPETAIDLMKRSVPSIKIGEKIQKRDLEIISKFLDTN